ncbi:MAG: hypothetical protein ACXWUL_03055 [Caldimonas sp.]
MFSETVSDARPAGLSGQAVSSLFQAVTGLRNHRAVVAMLGCMFLGVLVAGMLMAMTGTLGVLAPLLAFVVWVVAIGTGVNAAGLLQMDHARGISPRSTADALVYGLMCIPKLIVLALAFIAVLIAVFVVVALLLLMTKIPFLGPLLFVVVFPASVVVVGVTVVGLLLCLVLSLPAIWQGANITRALAQTMAIVRSRLVEAVLLLLVLSFLGFAVGLIVWVVLFAGLLPTIGMSMSIVGFGGGGGFGMESLMGLSRGGGHAVAGAIGIALLGAIVFSLVGQVYLLGLSLVYLRVTEGLDLTASEEALRAGLDQARRRTAELGERARQAAQRDSPAAGAADTAPGAGAVGAAAAGAAAAGAVGTAAAATTAGSIAPATYGSPPAFAAAPTPAFDAAASDPYRLRAGEQTTLPPSGLAAPANADIALPFDDGSLAPPAPPGPSEWTPLPQTTAAPLPEAAPLPAATTCPQCLSSVAPDDTFCGVCGYRLK